MKILIIDDNNDIRSLLEITISSMGHQFDSVTNGMEGLELIKSRIYDMVFLDLTMPDFSGLDVLNALDGEGLCRRQPIVLFSASYFGAADIEEVLSKKNIHSTLPKPSSIDQIMKKINDIQEENST